MSEKEGNIGYWYSLAAKTILKYQDSNTGLIPAHPGSDTWVRDCTYALHSVWALSLAFGKQDTGSPEYSELRSRTVKGVRGLLTSMMGQAGKVDKFIEQQCHLECLHAKYNTTTGQPVVGDAEWGHLQLDSTSLFILTLAQITASGLVVVQTSSEVQFIQNLVCYIHYAYRTPDFGVFERGDKNNRGIRELSACSVGMAKSALVAIRGLNLFGSDADKDAVIWVPPDMSRQCNRVLQNILPRGSSSKEYDSSTLSVLSYPAFAVEKTDLIQGCKRLLRENLRGRYGYKRFLLDGYKTVLEDTSRLHYNPGELKQFEGVECEWPLYLIYSWLDELFQGDEERATADKSALDGLTLRDEEGFPLVPELYYVPRERVQAEKENRGSQDRVPGGKTPFIWAQSLYIVAGLVHNKHLTTEDIDPLNRRLAMRPRVAPPVQILLLSDTEECQKFAEVHQLPCLSIDNTNITVVMPTVVEKMWESLKVKRNTQSGVRQRVSSLRTSMLYQHLTHFYLSLPEYASKYSFYNFLDTEIMIQSTIARISYLSRNWMFPGQPVLAVLLTPDRCGEESMVRFLNSMKTGTILGVQVRLSSVEDVLENGFKQWIPTAPATDPSAARRALRFRTSDSISSLSEADTASSATDLRERVAGVEGSEGKLDVLIDHYNTHQTLPERPLAVELYNKGLAAHNWKVARYCAAFHLLTHSSISEDVNHILVNQKQLSLGSGEGEETISQPPGTAEFIDALKRHSKEDIILFVLYQEVISYICQMIQGSISNFEGILRFRLDRLIRLVALEVTGSETDLPGLCKLTPIQLYRVISGLFGGVTRPEEGCSWGRRRRVDGVLNRVPVNFQNHVYAILSRCHGIRAGTLLPSFPLVQEMTPGEPQFAIAVHNWLDRELSSQRRQLYIETIVVLGSTLKMIANLPDVVDLDYILEGAMGAFNSGNHGNDGNNNVSRDFLMTPPTGKCGTLSYIIEAIAQFC
eukprot:sb/3461665/